MKEGPRRRMGARRRLRIVMSLSANRYPNPAPVSEEGRVPARGGGQGETCNKSTEIARDGESLAILELKLELARVEKDRIKEQRQKTESEWEIQKQRIQMGVTSNSFSDGHAIRGDMLMAKNIGENSTAQLKSPRRVLRC